MASNAGFWKRALKQPELAQVEFDIAVLDRYLSDASCKVTRTRTVGRVKAATWSADFGIAPDETSVHLPLQTLRDRVPEAEREHFLAHTRNERLSANFLKMLQSHACIDDGNTRPWNAPDTEPEGESFF